MALVGFFMSLVSLFFMVIALIPFLGWLHWFVAPFAFIGLIVNLISVVSGGRRLLGFIGVVMCLGVMFTSIMRLVIGLGVI